MEEIGDRIWRVQSSVPGPSLLIVGGMHGNEAAGIETVQCLQKEFSEGRTLASGTLTLALANTGAIDANQRWVDGRDLNRYFSATQLIKGDGSWEAERATTLAALVREADITVDIHSTNKPSVPFICSSVDADHERIYRWFSAENIIEDPEYIFGDEPVAIDEYADQNGKIGMCVEAGWVGETGRVEETIASVEAILSDLGLSDRPLPSLPTKTPNTYRYIASIKLDERGFSFAPGKGMRSFEPINTGEVIGHRGEEPVLSEVDGVIVFPKLPEHQQIGKPVCYIATKL